MPSLSSLLLRIPDDFKPLAAIGIGALILVLLVLFHGFGLHKILVYFKRADLRFRIGRPHLWRVGILFGWCVFLMLFLHILEIFAWAFFLFHLGLVLRRADAIYFCANAYTTLGYGAVDLNPAWRNISPIIAISGLFTFAWTTSSLVSIISSYLKLIEQLELERMEQLDLRAAARKSEKQIFLQEKAAEKTSREDARKQAEPLSFFQRRRVWHEEREKEKQMRAAERDQLRAIIRKENQDEDKLGTGKPDDPEAKL